MAKNGIMHNVVNFLKNSPEGTRQQTCEQIPAKAEGETREQYQEFLQRKIRHCYEGIVILHN